jgi:Carboxypeptidase regulatory-like domain
MRNPVAYVVSILLFMLPAFAQSSSTASGSITGDVFTKGTNGELAVLPGVLIVLHRPITKETESAAQGAFAIDNLPPGTYQIEATAPGLYAALAVEVSAGTSSTVPVEMNVAAVTSITSPQLTRLKAMDCAFSREPVECLPGPARFDSWRDRSVAYIFCVHVS